MDINLPGMNSVDATRDIAARHPETVVVLVSTYEANPLPLGAASSARGRTCTRNTSTPTCSSRSGTSDQRLVAYRVMG